MPLLGRGSTLKAVEKALDESALGRVLSTAPSDVLDSASCVTGGLLGDLHRRGVTRDAIRAPFDEDGGAYLRDFGKHLLQTVKAIAPRQAWGVLVLPHDLIAMFLCVFVGLPPLLLD